MVVVLALTACAVLAGARSLLAVGEWIADAPPQVLQAVGAPPRSSASQAAPACGIGVPVRMLSPAANGDDLPRVSPVWVSPGSYGCGE
ncbi:hypothetical protein [Streptomyces europaeiscabiei]|uniref:hypothetical protein n=1 Tax=Streptomyces europaeiscabiei TaxID=146819 RepID=UPI0029BA3A4B|nr:hypothetical protein [Streptomyces europaeiscabiei]MDX2524731.1 hypothetical protein [Streptomyces europaeiscabiei]MDX3783536.1 hypothetical protein [Streptomyces europaeiscabiei]